MESQVQKNATKFWELRLNFLMLEQGNTETCIFIILNLSIV